jgi:hypothetical protein
MNVLPRPLAEFNGFLYKTLLLYKYCRAKYPLLELNLRTTLRHFRTLLIKPTLCTIPSFYVYFYSLHVSGSCVSIIRRNNCISTTSVICHSVWMTVWHAGCIAPCLPDVHPHRVTNIRCRIDTVISLDDGQIAPETCREYK